MGVKQFSEFYDELQLELGERTDIADIDGTDFRKIWINTAYITLATQNKMWGVRKNHTFPELETFQTINTTDGDSTVDIPTDCMVLRHVWDSTNDTKLIRIPFSTYISYSGRETAASEGQPTQYVRNGDEIYLYPRPDDAYTLYMYYRKRPAKMVDDDDVTLIGAEWDEPILRLAVSLGLRKLQQYDEAKKEFENFMDLVRGVVGIYDQESYDNEDYRAVGPYNDFRY